MLEMTNRGKWAGGATIWWSPDLWTHQALLRWQDPCEVSQSHSPPLDHTCVFAQGWKMKSHGFMGPQQNIQCDKSCQHTPYYVGTPSRRKWWGLATIGRSPDLPMVAPTLHHLSHTFRTCQMTLALGFMAVLWRWIQWLHDQVYVDHWRGAPPPPPINRGSLPSLHSWWRSLQAQVKSS